MNKIFLYLMALLLFFNHCSKEDKSLLNNNDFILFGTYYGFCAGSECIRIYKFTENSLKEDTVDIYPGVLTDFYSGQYIELSEEKYQLALSLIDDFPTEFLDEESQVYGCPDCADQGGVYLEYNINGQQKQFFIDNYYGSDSFVGQYKTQIHLTVESLN